MYVLGVKAEDSLNSREMQGQGVLARLAEMTGGRVFHPADQGEASLAAVFASLDQELLNRFSSRPALTSLRTAGSIGFESR